MSEPRRAPPTPRRRPVSSVLCGLLLVAAGCSSERSRLPAPATDASIRVDAGRTSDAGPLPDGGASPDAGSAPDAGSNPGCASRTADFDAVVAAFSAQLTRAGIPGGAIAVVCDGAHVFAAGVGVTDLTSQTPVDGRTRFQVASNTKTLTAALAVRLRSQGVVDLGAPASTYLADINTSAPFDTEFTVEQLLSHSAGYPTYYPVGGVYTDGTLEGFFVNNGEAQLWSPPGAAFNYSNLGLSVAGLALQRAAQTPFGDLMERELFTPLGLTDSSMSASRVAAEGKVAFGHADSVASVVRPTDGYLASGYYGPMGGAWMSAHDLGRFARELMRPEVLGAEAVQDMARGRAETGWGSRYGLGLYVDDLQSETHLSHGGSVGGYLSGFDLYPESGFALVTMINGDWLFLEGILDLATARFTDIEDGDVTPYLPNPAEWPDFVGTYDDPLAFGEVRIGQTTGGLTIDIPDQNVRGVTLTPYTRTAFGFFYPPWDSELGIVFYREGATGPAKYIVALEGVAIRR